MYFGRYIWKGGLERGKENDEKKVVELEVLYL